MGGFNVKPSQIQANHIDMCKFSTREDSGYKQVSYMIKQVLKRCRGKSRKVATPGQPQQLLFQPPFPSSGAPYYLYSSGARYDMHTEIEVEEV